MITGSTDAVKIEEIANRIGSVVVAIKRIEQMLFAILSANVGSSAAVEYVTAARVHIEDFTFEGEPEDVRGNIRSMGAPPSLDGAVVVKLERVE
ncbi:MAG: hypothetical protein V2A58_16715 [Planctomycetota bacterium]